MNLPQAFPWEHARKHFREIRNQLEFDVAFGKGDSIITCGNHCGPEASTGNPACPARALPAQGEPRLPREHPACPGRTQSMGRGRQCTASTTEQIDAPFPQTSQLGWCACSFKMPQQIAPKMVTVNNRNVFPNRYESDQSKLKVVAQWLASEGVLRDLPPACPSSFHLP